MSACSFARKCEKGELFEYGTFRVTNGGTKQEERIYEVKGVKGSMTEALAANDMAINGTTPGRRHVEPALFGFPSNKAKR
jgi:hypothetical protein